MKKPMSIWQVRRDNPGHYFAKAVNSRFTAYVLSTQEKSSLVGSAHAVGYGGTPWIATHEAMLREGALSVELILKACIAKKIQVKRSTLVNVPMTHALDILWRHAELAPLDRPDQLRLLRLKQVLFWSGRYGAPRKDVDWEREQEEMGRLEDVEDVGFVGSMIVRRSVSLEFEDIDRIYMRAAEQCLSD